jgi:hypothetical protein
MPGKDDKNKSSNTGNNKQQQGGKTSPVGFNDTTKGGNKGGQDNHGSQGKGGKGTK